MVRVSPDLSERRCSKRVAAGLREAAAATVWTAAEVYSLQLSHTAVPPVKRFKHQTPVFYNKIFFFLFSNFLKIKITVAPDAVRWKIYLFFRILLSQTQTNRKKNNPDLSI